MSFGERLKELREKEDMTRDELGKRLGMSYSTIAKYETDNRFPDQDTLVNIADIFSVSVDYLLGNKKSQELPRTVAPYLPEGYEELSAEAKEEVRTVLEYVLAKYKKEDKNKK